LNVRLTIILAVVLAVIAGVVYLGQWGGGDSEDDTGGETRAFVYRMNADNIVHISIKHGELDYTFKRVEDGWVFEDAEQTPTNPDRLTGMQYVLAGPRADIVLEGEIANASEYGLDDPETIVEIADAQGLGFHLEFGNMNVDHSLQYVSLEGSEDVFLIHSSWTSVIANLAIEAPYIPTPDIPPEFLETPTPNL
jgi:hypothetical protein